MNEGSSRSHSVFTITVSQKDVITNATKYTLTYLHLEFVAIA